MYRKVIFAFLFVILMSGLSRAEAQVTSFAHNGTLAVADGNYEFEFKLFDTPTVGTGTQSGSTLQKLSPNTVSVMGNAFTVYLDFGTSVFNGSELYLETSWRPVGGSFVVLPTRERITAVYADYTLLSATAGNATNFGGLPPSGFIQNSSSQQAGGFNVAGNGTAGGTLSGNSVNAATQFNLGGNRLISLSGLLNDTLSVGVGAGTSSATSFNNSFFGTNAGHSNTEGRYNSFFGVYAGNSTTDGISNSFFGSAAGRFNTSGSENSFFGLDAGLSNTTGYNNSFFGSVAGVNITVGVANSFFGKAAGYFSTTANNNSFFGTQTGFANTTGSGNSFFGINAGSSNTTGSANTVLGANANLSANNLSNATAIGASAMVGQSNSLVLGSINGVNGATADTSVGIGTTAPTDKLHVSGTGPLRGRFNSDSNAGIAFSLNNQPKWSIATVAPGQLQIFNDATGQNAVAIDSANNKFGIGTTTPAFRLHVVDSSNSGLRVQTNAVGGAVASFGGNGAFQIDAPGVVGGRFAIDEAGNTGLGTATALDRLDVRGAIRFSTLASFGVLNLCRNSSNQIAQCSSSIRYKHNIAPLTAGLDLVTRLNPVTFDWKNIEERDLGLIAEDVAKVEPLLVTHNNQGEVEGVKYDRVAVVLLNAVKEQQQQIKQQAELIQRQQRQLDSLKRLACLRQPKAKICKS